MATSQYLVDSQDGGLTRPRLTFSVQKLNDKINIVDAMQ
jgi:hypothetical protein